MKLCRLSVLVLMLVSWSAAASIAGEITIGAKVGMTVSNVTGVPEEWEASKSSVTGFTGGMMLNYAFNDALSLQPELLYAQKGVAGNLYDGFVTVDATVNLSYFELPVLAKYTFLPGKSFRPCVFAGPSFAYSSSSELEVSASIASVTVDIGSLTHVTDFGLVLGGGFGYKTGPGILTFDARYEQGFTNVIMSGDFEINGSTETINVDDFKNYGFAFTVGYMF
jgi:hypothetical protein